jgi:hypothetical protein
VSGREVEHADVLGQRRGPFPPRWGPPPAEQFARFGWIRANAAADMIEKRCRRDPRRALLRLWKRRWEG